MSTEGTPGGPTARPKAPPRHPVTLVTRPSGRFEDMLSALEGWEGAVASGCPDEEEVAARMVAAAAAAGEATAVAAGDDTAVARSLKLDPSPEEPVAAAAVVQADTNGSKIVEGPSEFQRRLEDTLARLESWEESSGACWRPPGGGGAAAPCTGRHTDVTL